MDLALPPVIGHRGAAALAPENTLAGLRAAAAAGARWVEFDVKLTADDVPVLMHDDTLERTTDGRGAVAATTWSALRGLDAGGRFGAAFRGEPVPSFEQAIAELARLGLGANVEIKPCPGRAELTARRTVETIRAVWPAALPPPLVSSFETSCLAVVRDLAPDLARGYLADQLAEGWPGLVRALGCRTVHLGRRRLAERDVAAVREAGLPLLVWTVNQPDEAARWLAAGARSIITDRPDAILARIAERMDGSRQARLAAT